jgi:hypothetical protein
MDQCKLFLKFLHLFINNDGSSSHLIGLLNINEEPFRNQFGYVCQSQKPRTNNSDRTQYWDLEIHLAGLSRGRYRRRFLRNGQDDDSERVRTPIPLRHDGLDSLLAVFTRSLFEFFSGGQKCFEVAFKLFDLCLDTDIGIKLGESDVVPHLIGCRIRDALHEETTCVLEFMACAVFWAHVECSGAETRRSKTETIETTRERAGGSVLGLAAQPRPLSKENM